MASPSQLDAWRRLWRLLLRPNPTLPERTVTTTSGRIIETKVRPGLMIEEK